jgi:hypothetical protein
MLTCPTDKNCGQRTLGCGAEGTVRAASHRGARRVSRLVAAAVTRTGRSPSLGRRLDRSGARPRECVVATSSTCAKGPTRPGPRPTDHCRGREARAPSAQRSTPGHERLRLFADPTRRSKEAGVLHQAARAARTRTHQRPDAAGASSEERWARAFTHASAVPATTCGRKSVSSSCDSRGPGKPDLTASRKPSGGR